MIRRSFVLNLTSGQTFIASALLLGKRTRRLIVALAAIGVLRVIVPDESFGLTDCWIVS